MQLKIPEADFAPVIRRAWAPPENITVSQWAARHRVLPKQSAIPGLWSNELGPYAMGVMDAFNDPLVERIVIMASVQSMKTESVYNMLGWAISQDPAPALVVMPTDTTLKLVNKRIRDMITESPELSQYLTGDPDDMQKRLIVLRSMTIYFATAGSAPALANIEARYIIMDEADRYPLGLGEEGSPFGMAEARARTYWNRKILVPCTPTVPEGYVNLEYERSDKCKYWVPCPFCGGYQVLSFWQVKHQAEKLLEWPKERQDPEYIKAARPARYECFHCQAEIDDHQKQAMMARGKWVPEGHPISREGEMAPAPPVSRKGYWWNALYSPFVSFSEMAAEFFDSKGDREKYKNFVNLWLAEPWKEVVKVKEASALLELRSSHPALEVPDGTLALTAGIDNQRRGFWCSIWAWERTASGALNQHLVRYGFVSDFTELEIWLFQDVYHTRDGNGPPYIIWRGALDTGGGEGEAGDAGLTEQAYEWLRTRSQGRIFGIKGAARALAGGRKMQLAIIDKMPGKGLPIPGGIRLWHLDTNLFKDALWSRVEAGRVFFHADTGEEFVRQLTAEAKERDKRGRWAWTQQGRQANHYLDTAVYAAAMADPECLGGVMVLPKPEPARPRPVVEERKINPLTGKLRGSYWK